MAKQKTNFNIFDLFKISQWMRAQPQYGYTVAGFKRDQLSNLAEHHYLVTLIGWQLCELIEQGGGKIDKLKVLEICMIHDFGELFGGDIAMPYARVNKKAKQLSREFEKENMRFLSKYFVNHNTVNQLWDEATGAKTDEGYVAKISDFIETFCFKHYHDCLDKVDWILINERVPAIIKKISDKNTRKIMEEIMRKMKNFADKSARSIISGVEM